MDRGKLVSMDSPMLRVLYEDPKGLEIPNVTGTFEGCSNLKSIHADLFQYNADRTLFVSTFRGCSSLTEIPAGLFQYNVNTKEFFFTFKDCSSLTTIPADLFRYNTLAQGFGAVFENCTKLTEAPAGLFKYNTLSYRFYNAFKSCYHLKLNPAIFCDDTNTEKSKRFAAFKFVSFQGCFENAGRDLTDVSGNVAPELWKYRYHSNVDVIDATYCFKDANIANINDVPGSWIW